MSVTPLGCCLKCRPSDPKRYTWRFPNPGTKTWEVLNGQTATKSRSFPKFPQVEFHRMLDFQHSIDHHVSNLLKNLVKIPNASPTWKNSLKKTDRINQTQLAPASNVPPPNFEVKGSTHPVRSGTQASGIGIPLTWSSQKKNKGSFSMVDFFIKNSQSLVFWCCNALSETSLPIELDDMEIHGTKTFASCGWTRNAGIKFQSTVRHTRLSWPVW